MRAERNIFGQLVLLSTEHNVDLELTLSLSLGPVPWLMSILDCMPTKSDIYSSYASMQISTNMSCWRHISETFNVCAGNVRSVMLHVIAATLRGLTYFILWLI